MLSDCVDAVRVQKESDGWKMVPAPATPTAMVAVKADGSWRECTILMPEEQPRVCTPIALPCAINTAMVGIRSGYVPGILVVDIKTSPYLWAVLDTACNTSVISIGFADKAAARLA